MKLLETKFNVSLKILPFGHAVVELRVSEEEVKEEKIEQTPFYTEPKTTDTNVIEISFGGENYKIPKTTGGLL